MTDEYAPCHIVGATLSALIAAQDAGDREGEVLVLDQLNREDAIAGLVAAAIWPGQLWPEHLEVCQRGKRRCGRWKRGSAKVGPGKDAGPDHTVGGQPDSPRTSHQSPRTTPWAGRRQTRQPIPLLSQN